MKKFSSEPEAAYDQVVGHVLELHCRWSLWRKLYRQNEDSHAVLEATGSELFWLLGRVLHRGSFQLFRQLTDPARTGGRDNASLLGLLMAIAGSAAESEHADLILMLPDAEVTDLIRKHANRYVSHLDLELLSGRDEAPTDVEIQQVEEALTAIDTFMNEVGGRFFDTRPFPYCERADLIRLQADRLVHLLRLGVAQDSRS